MPVSQICGRCGAELAASTLSGYCPSCLLREALVDFHGAGGGLESPEPEHPGVQSKPQSQKPEPKDRSQELRGSWRVVCGQRFGEYELLEKVGQGGMGVVYKAKQLKLERIVALKLLPFGQFSREQVVQRFRAEATAAAGLQHPNIVAIHDIGEQDGQHFFSMDYIEGPTLADLVRERPLPPRRAATYLKTIAEAAHYAHQRGILHRDLKPSNILIDGADQPQITDFGLAKRMDEATQITLTGQVLGSPDFMAPEQAQGHGQAATPTTDIYGLGGLLYFMLTGRPPFQANTLTGLLKQVAESDPVAPRLLNPSIPIDLETICLKCLEKHPKRRYAAAGELSDELSRFIEGQPILARPVGSAGKLWRWCRRQPVRAALASRRGNSERTGLVPR